VPNYERETIWLRDVIESESFATSRSKLTLSMGKDINGRIVVADLATMPHVLIAGSTGSGKSVAINAMIMSRSTRPRPSRCASSSSIPNASSSGCTKASRTSSRHHRQPKLAANALRQRRCGDVRRLKLLASRSVRNIEQTIASSKAPPPRSSTTQRTSSPPLHLIIIDELAEPHDGRQSQRRRIRTRLAQMARAPPASICARHPAPSVDVITGLIKANVPSRISFRLATKVDSRTILGLQRSRSAPRPRRHLFFRPPPRASIASTRLWSPKKKSPLLLFLKSQARPNTRGFL